MSFQDMAWAVTQKCSSAGEKLVLLMLANHCNFHTKQCNPSHSALADECSMGASTLKRHIASLEQSGFLVIQHRVRENVSLPNQYFMKSPDLAGVGPNWTDVSPDRAEGMPKLDGGVGPNRATKQEVKPVIKTKKETHTAKPKSSKACAVKDAQTKTVCVVVDLKKLPKAQKTEQPSPVNTPKPTAPLEVTLENLATVLKASGIEASAAVQADAVAITLTKGKALDYAVGTVKRKLASGEAAPATFAPAAALTTPSVQPVYKHPEVTVASKAVRDAALAALTVKLAPTAPVSAPDAGNTAFTPLVGEFKWAVDIITQKRQEFTNKVLTSKIGNRAFTNACEVLRVNKKTLNQE